MNWWGQPIDSDNSCIGWKVGSAIYVLYIGEHPKKYLGMNKLPRVSQTSCVID